MQIAMNHTQLRCRPEKVIEEQIAELRSGRAGGYLFSALFASSISLMPPTLLSTPVAS